MSVDDLDKSDVGNLPRLWLPGAPGPRLWLPNITQRQGPRQFLLNSGIYAVSEDTSLALRSSLRRVPIEEFLTLVSNVSLISTHETAQLTEFLQTQGWKPQTAMRQYQLALLVRLMLKDYRVPDARQWPVADQLGKLRLLVEWSRMASEMLALADKPAPSDSYDDGAATLVRLANQQFGDFESLRSLYPRAILLFGECCRESEKSAGTTLSAIIHEKIGLQIDEILFLSLGLYAKLNAGKTGRIIEPKLMANSPAFTRITEGQIQRLFEWLSVDYERFCAATLEPKIGAEEGYEPYHFNPLVEHPIIKMPDGSYVLPITHYLFRRVSTGLFYDLVRSSDAGTAGRILGRAIEVYVELLMEDLPSHGTILPEQNYSRGKTTCEWILNDPEGIVLVECKRISLRQRAKTTGKKEDVKRDLAREDGVGDGIAKLVETAEAISAGKLPEISSGRRILPLLISFDEFFLANCMYIRQILSEVLEEKSVRLPEGFRYQICSISEFEKLCVFLTETRRSLAWALASKIDGEFNVPNDHPTEQWDFSAWVSRAQPSESSASLPSHDRVYREDLEEMINRFR